MNKKQVYKYLIVGFGNIGRKRKDVLGKKVVATLDPNPNAQADFTSLDEIDLKTMAKFNCVVITVPRKEKIEAVEYWLKKGKNILVEKPMILTLKQAKKLQVIARKNKVIWYTAYNYRFEPNIVTLKKLISEGVLGKLYTAHMVYGFGNVAQLKDTWRGTGFGALDEVGVHLIDFAQFLFGYKNGDFEALFLSKTEAKTYDHCLLSTKDRKIIIEASWIMWKNVFSMDIYGELGSFHMKGLCKWGESELIIRTRVLPAGIPPEKRYIEKGPPDPTWKEDIKEFEKMVRGKKTSFKTDTQITEILLSIITGYTSTTKKEALDKLLESPNDKKSKKGN